MPIYNKESLEEAVAWVAEVKTGETNPNTGLPETNTVVYCTNCVDLKEQFDHYCSEKSIKEEGKVYICDACGSDVMLVGTKYGA